MATVVRRPSLVATAIAIGAVVFAAGASDPSLVTSDDQPVSFERDVKPILEASCFQCHGPHAKRIKGGLMMDGREALLVGGDDGPSIVPGKPDESLLIQLVRHEIELFEMPPDEEDKLSQAQIEVLERWVAEGADWPGGSTAVSDRREIDFEQGRQWWAFRPLERPVPPPVEDPSFAQRVQGDIDAFIFDKLLEAQLPAAPEASDRVLLRRLHIDLLGMPPTQAEVTAYERDSRADKWALKIDELLARPQYGERWGRYWLDVVRFAQTNGYEKDAEKPYIWRYRDYVIDAFNQDKPYDRFLLEQLAGDEMEPQTDEGVIATGFYHLGVWDSEPNDREQAVFDGHDDVLRTISEGVMGVTVGCARCHDHRTDPIRQQDYFSLMSFLRGIEPYKVPSFDFESTTHRLLGDSPEVRAEWERKRVARAAELEVQREALYNRHLTNYVAANFDRLMAAKPREAAFKLDENSEITEVAKSLGVVDSQVRRSMVLVDRLELFQLEAECKKIKTSFAGDLDWALCAVEVGAEAPETHLHHRGRAAAKREVVEPNFPPVLCPDDESSRPQITPRADISTGRRLALAKWITDPTHPTTARVFVNRVWQGHFGRGLVSTPNDFGVTGSAPSHPRLLDWLASEFVDGGWRVKDLHRKILNSAVYRMASNFESEAAELSDPDNALLWRHDLRRLDAESLHDSILAVSGQLNPETGGRGYFAALSREALAGGSRPGWGWGNSSTEERNRRAVYSYVKRGLLVPFLTVFDFVDPTNPQGKRASTTVASQALTLLNGEFANRNALAMARDLAENFGDDRACAVRELYRRLLQREPSASELRIATQFLERQAQGMSSLPERMTFRPAVPNRADIGFLSQLSADQLLDGPSRGWRFERGLWGNGYNMTQEADREQGPVALLIEPQLPSGRVIFDLIPDEGCELASFLVRAHESAGRLVGLQVEFDLEQELVRLIYLKPSGETQELARAACAILPGERAQVGLEFFEAEMRVWVNREKLINVKDAGLPLAAGHFGVRVTGEALHLENLVIQAGQERFSIDVEQTASPQVRALALLCLTTFSLNEFLYAE